MRNYNFLMDITNFYRFFFKKRKTFYIFALILKSIDTPPSQKRRSRKKHYTRLNKIEPFIRINNI